MISSERYTKLVHGSGMCFETNFSGPNFSCKPPFARSYWHDFGTNVKLPKIVLGTIAAGELFCIARVFLFHAQLPEPKSYFSSHLHIGFRVKISRPQTTVLHVVNRFRLCISLNHHVAHLLPPTWQQKNEQRLHYLAPHK